MNQQDTTPNSKRKLLLIFTLALLIFLFLRWDISPWLATQIQQAAKQAGVNVQYEHISVSGFTVQLNQLQISKANEISVQLQEVRAGLAWDALLSGKLGVHIEALWQTNPLSLTIIQQGESLQLNNISAVVDISRIQQFMTSIPAKISGVIEAKGQVRLNPSTQKLESGNLEMVWNQAKAGLTQPKFTLGNYHIKLYSDEQNNQPWHWDISGGSGVALKGNGSISPQQPDPQWWALNGLMNVKVDQTNPSLAMMMQSMMGTTEASLRISGTLGKPRTEIVR
jgi:autotransporter translocation and assembly factor TamB